MPVNEEEPPIITASEDRPYVIRVAVYEGDYAAILEAVGAVVPDDGSCFVWGRFEDNDDVC